MISDRSDFFISIKTLTLRQSSSFRDVNHDCSILRVCNEQKQDESVQNSGVGIK